MRNKRSILVRSMSTLIIVLGITYLALNMFADRQLAEAQLLLTNAGYSSNLSSIKPASVADTDNAAILYTAVNNLLSAEGWKSLPPHEQKQRYPELRLDELNQFAVFLERKNVQEVVAILDEASKRTFCQRMESDVVRTPLGWRIFPFLYYGFQTYFKQKKYAQALLFLQLNIAYSSHVSQDHNMVSCVFAWNRYRFICKQTQQLAAAQVDLPNNILASIENGDIKNSFFETVHNECLLYIEWMFEESNRQKVDDVSQESNISKPLWVSWYGISWIRKIEHVAAIRDALKMFAYMESFYGARHSVSADDISGDNIFIDTAQFLSFRDNALSISAELAITKAGLACLNYHQEHGIYPRALVEIGEFIDPYTEQALCYNRNEHGFKISTSLSKKVGNIYVKSLSWSYVQP